MKHTVDEFTDYTRGHTTDNLYSYRCGMRCSGPSSITFKVLRQELYSA